MINYIKRKIKKIQLKNTFDEYGFEIKKFQVNPSGSFHF